MKVNESHHPQWESAYEARPKNKMRTKNVSAMMCFRTFSVDQYDYKILIIPYPQWNIELSSSTHQNEGWKIQHSPQKANKFSLVDRVTRCESDHEFQLTSTTLFWRIISIDVQLGTYVVSTGYAFVD